MNIGVLTDKQKKKAGTLYSKGLTVQAVADSFGCSRATVDRALDDLGVEKRARGNQSKLRTGAIGIRWEKYHKLKTAGKTWQEIGDKFGISKQAVQKFYIRWAD